MNLKDSTVLTGVQGEEMREQEGAGSPGADGKNNGNGEKAFGDKWTGCIVKGLTMGPMRYGNGRFKKGERCKP